uniref:Ig-like domain-containing protein n=1 Tax=Terrapene triunguis TaxID=2587831 RepID=A0A674K273_9SAUR
NRPENQVLIRDPVSRGGAGVGADGDARLPAAENMLSQVEFYQRTDRSQQESGQYTQGFNQDEMFYVDLERKETVWRLPDFGKFASFEAQLALGNAAVGKQNLEIMIKRSNRTQAENVPPEVTVFPRGPVELGEPNILICFVDKFSPPVLSVTWLKNGQEVTGGVYETDFYPRQDNSFRKFSYLPFVPSQGDFYDCRVEHGGLPETFTIHWGEAGAPGEPAGHRAGSCPCTPLLGLGGTYPGRGLLPMGLGMGVAPRQGVAGPTGLIQTPFPSWGRFLLTPVGAGLHREPGPYWPEAAVSHPR